jgi:hypothetical protein
MRKDVSAALTWLFNVRQGKSQGSHLLRCEGAALTENPKPGKGRQAWKHPLPVARLGYGAVRMLHGTRREHP